MDISAASVDPISKTAPDEDIRPLVPLAGSEIAGGGTIAAETMAAWRRTPAYAELLTYFESYPPRSLMGPHSRAILFSLIRMLRPKVVAEVGTLFAGTTETLAHAPWENGEGVIHTTDPFGADRCPRSSAAGRASCRRSPNSTRSIRWTSSARSPSGASRSTWCWSTAATITSMRIRLDLRGSAMTFMHPFTLPLHTDMTSRCDEVGLFFEINLSWRADPGSPPLPLLRVPTPLPA